MQNIQVNMQFNADTSNATSQIQQLQNTLKSIATTHVNVQGGSIDQAVQSAQLLSQHLTAATNVNTGKLDFTKLQTSLKAANTDLTTLTNNLLAMGPKGQQAFSQVANAVAHAELSVKKTNAALAAFGTTLMNTIKWQAASTLIHGVMSAFSSAVGHIEKLDSALNKIQVVTGKTSAEMAGFAKRAQALSKELSSTTEEYAKASLIFFQQGLGEEQVLKRTEATIKMAKVTGEAVQTVSDQLTAIWNNFDNGSQSLEYYVDVITALGAATASSTSEISDGLQKFAAIAETVGLSYEYAATALATVTAETRQSADVVGTAFKTLFARMEGLKLGETLDDGTTLNQYSQAMAKAGINIKDANGNLKDMDVILDEMGAKWQTLNKDQQVALAQQVGGIRQYNQLIALMDNWDTFKINLEIAEDSEGTLDRQMEVYQTSIEASEKALQNAKETLYETLFNSEMLKDFNNGLTDILEMFTRIVEKAGGLQGLLKFGGLLLLKTLLPNLMGFVTKITGSISNVIGLTKKQKINEVDNLSKTSKKMAGQDDKPARTWGGKTDRAGAKFQKAQALRDKEDPSQRDLKRADRIQGRGAKAAGKLIKKEAAIDSHEQKAKDARAAREEENEARARIGKKPKSEGFGERWHRRRAEGMEERATTGVTTRNTLGVKSDQLPAAKMDTSGSAGQMADSISKEQAGYTAAILDSKKEYLILEDSLTEKQKAQYKNYEDQINAENDLLRIARERQLVSKETADESKSAATAAVEMSEGGGQKIEESARSQAEAEIGKTKIGARKKQYDSMMGMIAKQEEELGEEREDEDDATKAKRTKLKQQKEKVQETYGQDVKEYESQVTEKTNLLMSDPSFSKKVDMGGDNTAKAAERLQKQTGTTSIANEQTGAVTQVQTAQAATMESMQAELTPGDSGAPAVSVENLEKLGALQGQYNADAQVAVDLQGELGTAIGIAGDKTQKGTKAYEAGNKSLKQAGQFAQKYSKEVGAAADEMAASGKYTDKQIQAVRTLAKEGAQVDLENMDPQDLAAIQAALGKVEGGLTKAGAAAAQMADGMADDMANATGATKDTFTAVTAGAQQLAADTANADQQAMKLQTTMQKPVPIQPDPYGGLVMGAQGAMQAITSMAMGAQMLSMGLQTAFDPDATGIEKLTGWMMIMQGAQSLLNLTTAAGNIVNGISNVIGAIAIGIKEKGFGAWIKEIALKGLDTAATIVNAVAKVFNAEASKGLAGVIIGVLAAALIIGTIAMVANTVKTEQSTKAAQENADKKKAQAEGAREAAEAAREELDAVIELTEAYMDALKVYEETGEGKEDLRKAAFDAIDAMNLEGHELEILAGNYANLTARIKEYNAAKAGKAIDTSNTSLSSSGAAFLAQENVDGTGGLWTTEADGQKYLTLHLGDSGDDEGALNRWLDANESPWVRDGNQVKAAYTSSADIPYLMKEFYRMYDGVSAIATTAELSDMEFFSEAQEMRDSGSWDQGKELAAAYDTHTDTAITGAKAVELTGVTTQAGYNEAYDNMVKYTLEAHGLAEEVGKAYEDMSAEARGIIDALDSNLRQDEDWSNFELKRRGLNSIKTKYGDSAAADYITEGENGEKSALQKWAEESGVSEDDAIDMFLKINPQYYNSEAEIDEALAIMQQYLDANKIIVKYDLINGAKAALKETMSSADWSNFYSQYKDLFDPNSENYIGMSFEDFTNKSHSERQALLSSQQGDKVQALDDQVEAEEGILEDMTSDETGWKQNYIDNKMEEIDAEYDTKVQAQRDSVVEKYSAAQIANFTDTGSSSYGSYMGEATRWKAGVGKEGGMSQEEYDAINDWATQNGWNSAEQYLKAKYEYLNTMNGQNGNNFGDEFKISNIDGIGTKQTAADIEGEATAAYESEVAGQETKIAALKDERHLASLAATDAAITEFDLDAEEVYTQAEAIQEMATSSDEFADSLADDAAAAREASKEMSRYNKAVEELESGYSDWSDALKSGNLTEQVKAAKELDTVYSNMLDLDFGSLSNEFLMNAKNLELAQQAANGSQKAYNELQIAAANDIYTQKIGELSEETLAAIERVANADDIDVGEKIVVGESTVADDLWTIYNDAYMAAIEGGKSVAEAKAIANEMMQAEGFNVGEIEMEEKEVTVTGQLPTGYKPEPGTVYTDSNGVQHKGTDWSPVEGETYTYTTTMLVPKAGGKSSFTKSAEQVGGKKSSGSGGGGSKKKADEVKKSDVVDRYKEVTDALDNNTEAMNKASRAADRLYGKDRLAKMKEVNSLLQKEIDLTKKKREEAEAYLEEDRTALEEKLKEAGIKFKFDPATGDVLNYTEEMTKLYEELDAKIQSANKDGNATDKEQEEIDAIQEKIDAVKDALADYEETKELIEDLDTELEEKFNAWQDANFEILNTELELKIEINDMDLQRLEYYLGKMEDDFYQMAEAAALMVLNGAKDGFGGQLTSYMDQLQHQEDYLSNLHKAYAANEISQASYIEGLKNASSAIYENLTSLKELDASMMSYYSETLAAAGEELAKYIDLMENATGVLDHYSSIAEMLGKSIDYKYMGKILQAQADVAGNAYKVSKSNYEMLKAQEDERKRAYEEAVARKASDSELELLEQQWWDAREAANEAQDTMLSDVETWAEALRTVLDNAIADFGQELEETLSAGYGSFDAMSTAFERKNALQEEYLTTTNKIYETNKMMRTAQQEIDKTTNEAAKRRLKQFISETGALQDQTKLSQYELDIQQAKYDLLLAEIALQEAQNAKSTVRLQRDNEGNMSYVYTADANKVAEAQQKVEDAQNALYNKGLEGANDYVQKYQETMQEMYDTITEIQQNYLDGAYENETEYNAAIEEAKEYYYDKLTQYSNLYQVALTTDTRVAADAWTTEFASMTEHTGDWMAAVNGYVGDVKGAFAEWKQQMDTIEQDTLNNMDQTLSNIVSDSDDLAKTVIENVIPALEDEMDAVKSVTDKYATFRETLESVTAEYEAMAKAAEDAVKAANGLEDGTDSGNPGDGNNNNNNNNNGDENNNNNNNNGNNNSTTLTWERVKAVYNAINGGKWGTGSDRKKNGKAAGYTDEEIAKGQELINKVYGGMSLAAAKKALGFASGGYTGDWSGSYGKLAFLHQKELILNKGDTENFLASMGILERILQMIDLQAASAQLGGLLAMPKFNHNNNEVLEQNVHIEASFPGVSDHNEIELAMTNLINTASQYANRK